MPRLPKIRLPELRLPTQPRKRRLAIFALVLGGLLLVEQIPGLVFRILLGYPWSHHGLSVQWRILSISLNVLVVLFFLLTEVKALWKWLPRLYLVMLGLLLFCVWSALYLFFVERGSRFGFQLSMWHMLAGRIAAPLFIIYLFQHVLAWRSSANPTERKAGRWLTIYVAITLGVGFVFSVLGGPSELKFLPVHSYGSLLIPILVIWHVRAERRWRERSGPAPTMLAARVPSFGRRGTLIALVVSLIMPLFPLGSANHWFTSPSSFLRFAEATATDAYRVEDPPAGYTEVAAGKPFEPSRITSESGRVIPTRFLQQADGCAYEGCHTDIGKQWAVSGHRHARNLFVEKTMGLLASERGAAATRYCAGCHDPVNVLGAQIDEHGSPIQGVLNEGVTCLACHAVSAAHPAPGNGSVTIAATPLFFDRTLNVSQYLMTVLYLDDHRAELDRKDVLRDTAICESCHRHTVPSDINPHAPVITDRVGEWRASKFSNRADPDSFRDCRDCHMPLTVESYQSTNVRGHRFLSSNTGVAALYADDPQYDAYAQRNFRGVQQAKFTHAENLQWIQDRLRNDVIVLELQPNGAAPAPGGAAALVATVSNRGVGHGWPAGIPDLVEAWLQIEVQDARGAWVWSSGVPDDRGNVPADAHRFGEEWFDDAGRRLTRHETWKLAEVRNERRIPSGGQDKTELAFAIPADSVGPLRVRARLRHRRFRQDFIDWTLGVGSTLPITDIQDVSLELPLAPPG